MASLNKPEESLLENPYIGPRTFQPSEAHKFFGRAREARNLIGLIISHRLVLFYAQSGSGKSSLINAKLIPGLTDEGFEVLPVGRVSGSNGLTINTENIFVYNLISSLHQEKKEPPGFPQFSLSEFLDNLVQKDGKFLYDEQHVYADEVELKPRVLLIDQFEEILTTNTPFWKERESFFQQLGDALEMDDQLWIVLAMREDFIAGLDPYHHCLPDGLQTRFYMQQLDRRSAMMAIKNPAEIGKRPFAPGAAEILVDNLREIRREETAGEKLLGEYVEPVQLQAVCYQMWEKLKTIPGKQISVEDVDKFADVNTALINFYEDTVADTVANTAVSEPDLRNWFSTNLITEAGTRNMVYRGDDETGGLPTPIADYVKNKFILREIVRPGGIWYELVHDRLVEPVLKANGKWQLEQPLIRLAQKWADANRSESFLLGEHQLTQHTETNSNWEALGPLITEYVETSQKALEDKQEALRQREMAHKEALANEQRRRADEAETAAIKQGRLTKIAFVIGGVALLFAILAGLQWNAARKNAQVAQDLAVAARYSAQDAQDFAVTAVAERELAVEARGTAVAESTRASVAEALADERAKEADAERIEANASEANAISLQKEADRLLAINTVKSLIEKASSLRIGTHANDELAALLVIEALNLSSNIDDLDEADAALVDNALREILQIKQFSRVEVESDEPFNAVAISPDSSTLAAGNIDNSITLIDLNNPTNELQVLTGHSDWVGAVAFSPDGSLLASGGEGATILLWDLNDLDHEPQILAGHSGRIGAVAFSPDGSLLASGSGDATIRLWDLNDLDHEPQVLAGHLEWVGSVAFSPDGSLLASGSDDTTIRLWDLNDLDHEPQVLAGHLEWVGSVAFSPDGSLLASGSDDATIRLWDLNDFDREPQVFEGHLGWVRSVAFSPDGSLLASGGEDATIRLWDLNDFDREPQVLAGHSDWVGAVAFSPDGSSLASGSGDATVRSWDINDNEPQVLAGHSDWVGAVAASPDGSLLASGSGDATIRLWDLNDLDHEPQVLAGHSGFVRSVAFSPDGSLLASVGEDATIRLWDLNNLDHEPQVLAGHSDWVGAVAFSPDSSLLANGGEDATVRLWDLNDLNREPQVLAGHSDWVGTVAFSPDGSLLASGSGDATVRLWDLNDLDREPQVLEGHSDWVGAVAFSPNGSLLASGSGDATVQLWNLSSLDNIHILEGDIGWISSVSFSPNSSMLASSSGNFIQLWNLSDLDTEPRLFEGHSDNVNSVIFSHDSEFLISGSNDGTVRLWYLSEEKLKTLVCQRVRNNLSFEETRELLFMESLYHMTCPQWGIPSPVAEGLIGDWDDASRDNLQQFTNDLHEKYPTIADEFLQQISSAFVSRATDLAKEGQEFEALALLAEAQRFSSEVDTSSVGRAFADGWQAWESPDLLEHVETFAEELAEQYPEAADAFRKQMSVNFVSRASNLAAEGQESEALALLADAQQLDSEVDTSSIGWAFARAWQAWEPPNLLERVEAFAKTVADQYPEAAKSFRVQMSAEFASRASNLARGGQAPEALALLADAQQLNADIDIAGWSLDIAINLIQGGQVENGVALFQDTLESNTDLSVPAFAYNEICWAGSIWGFAKEVLFACKTAVSLDPSNVSFGDRYGVALALLGNKEAAVAYFRQFVESESDFFDAATIQLRAGWIEELEAGRNPFIVNGEINEELLQILRNETAYEMFDFSVDEATLDNLEPGQLFTVTWSLQNTGTITWTGDFQIAYLETTTVQTQDFNLSQMGAPDMITLQALTGQDRVQPDETIKITMPLIAPTSEGDYAFHWQLHTANGTPFGGVRRLRVFVQE